MPLSKKFSDALSSLSPDRLAEFGERHDVSTFTDVGEPPDLTSCLQTAGVVRGADGYTAYFFQGDEEEALLAVG